MKFGGLRKSIFLLGIFLFAVLTAGGASLLWLMGQEEPRRFDKDREIRQEAIPDATDMMDGFREKPVHLLILGLDDEEVRSDVILLVRYDMNTGTVSMLSIPRDTLIYVKGKPEKINALISMGGERLVVATVAKLTGLQADYYLTLNFAGFRKIVDTLGGVEFDVPFDMNYDDPVQDLHIHLKKGRQLLDGRKAEQLVRYRKGNRRNEGYEDADIGRIHMQQSFLKELIRQKGKLKYLSKADDIFFILKDSVTTNIGLWDIRHYMKYAGSIREENTHYCTLPGDTAYRQGVWYFIHDPEKTRELIAEKFK